MECLPKLLKFLVRGLGRDEESSELVSYLMFENEYLSELIELGYKDAMEKSSNIEDFFNL